MSRSSGRRSMVVGCEAMRWQWSKARRCSIRRRRYKRRRYSEAADRGCATPQRTVAILTKEMQKEAARCDGDGDEMADGRGDATAAEVAHRELQRGCCDSGCRGGGLDGDGRNDVCGGAQSRRPSAPGGPDNDIYEGAQSRRRRRRRNGWHNRTATGRTACTEAPSHQCTPTALDDGPPSISVAGNLGSPTVMELMTYVWRR
ncbi:lysine-specific demethylase 2A [Striga asiatica]|uniref:Lysine-specific demethylase 2A n=1 Tax=Striga asiatica TaxID=4170 RepID=A0A5A7PKX3_STRAF|nr:lysine-specific demethylase 2A [Striga asiatica]